MWETKKGVSLLALAVVLISLLGTTVGKVQVEEKAFSLRQLFVASEKGSDKNSGVSPRFPLATVAHAFSLVKEWRTGDSFMGSVAINLLAGRHFLYSTIDLDSPLYCGLNEHSNVILRAFPQGASVSLSSARKVELLERNGDYYTTLDKSEFPQLQVWQAWTTLNERVGLVSTPLLHYESRSTSKASRRGLRIKLEPNSSIEGDWRKAYAYVYHSWTASISQIVTYNSQSQELTINGSLSGFYAGSGNRFRIVNAVGTQPYPGSMTFDSVSRQLRYRPRLNLSSSSVILFVPTLRTLLNLTNCSYLNVVGLKFEHTDSFLEDCLYRGCDGTQASGALPDAVLNAKGVAREIHISNCTFAHIGSFAMRFDEGSAYIAVSRCHMHDLAAGGIRIGQEKVGQTGDFKRVVHNISVTNSRIHDGGHVVEEGEGIFLQQAHSCSFLHNSIYDLFYSGIGLGWSWDYRPTWNFNITIHKNEFFNLGRGRLSDMGCVHNLGVSHGTVVSNNLCHDVQSYGYGGNGLYTDQGSMGLTFVNNIVYRTKCASMLQHYGLDVVVVNNVFAIPAQLSVTHRASNGVYTGFQTAQAPVGHGAASLNSFHFVNNIVYQNDPRQHLFTRSEVFGFRNSTLNRNCYWNTKIPNAELQFPTYNTTKTSFTAWKQVDGKDVNSIVTDPLFENPEQYDFVNISKHSPCLGIGFQPIDMSNVGAFWED